VTPPAGYLPFPSFSFKCKQQLKFIVSDRKMNDYGALVNDIEGENLKWYAKNLFQVHFIQHKPHVD
jgi:hypothetical protein